MMTKVLCWGFFVICGFTESLLSLEDTKSFSQLHFFKCLFIYSFLCFSELVWIKQSDILSVALSFSIFAKT